MSGYRDELDAVRHRVSTLEAQLAERDASLRAREAELAERTAEAQRIRAGGAASEPTRGTAVLRAILAIGAPLLVIVGLGYMNVRTELSRSEAEIASAKAEAHRAQSEAARAHNEAERVQAELAAARADAARRTFMDAAPVLQPAIDDVAVSGTLNINSIPVSKVLLDGRPLGSTPKIGVSVTPGEHVVTFLHPELGKKTVTLTVRGNETKMAAVKFEKP